MADTLTAVGLPGRTGAFDVALDGASVSTVTPTPTAGAPSQLVLPAFHEPHTHADRAFGLSTHPPASLADAIAMSRRLRAESSAAQIRERARRLFHTAAGHGAVTMRTHVVPDTIEDNLRPVREAATDAALEVEIVAFAGSELDPATTAGGDRLRAALDAGAGVLGAYVADNPDPAASLDALLDLSVDTGAPVDVHLDEHHDADAAQLAHLAEATIARGLEGRVTAGHCCALTALEPERARATVERVAAAGITVIVLPALNLYLQDRAAGTTPRQRGVTLVHELLAAGVPIRVGSDNVRDPFYPYGDADPLEAAWLAGVAAQIDDEATLLAAIAGGRSTIEPGDPAELVLVPATSLTDALARRPAGRRVLRPDR